MIKILPLIYCVVAYGLIYFMRDIFNVAPHGKEQTFLVIASLRNVLYGIGKIAGGWISSKIPPSLVINASMITAISITLLCHFSSGMIFSSGVIVYNCIQSIA